MQLRQLSTTCSSQLTMRCLRVGQTAFLRCELVGSCQRKRLISTKRSFSTVSQEESWTTFAVVEMAQLLRRMPESALPTS